MKLSDKHILVLGLSTQREHLSQLGMNRDSTWSPTVTPVTPSPTLSTTPAPSWPKTRGWSLSGRVRSVSSPQTKWPSVAQIPAEIMRTLTSPSRGGSTTIVLKHEFPFQTLFCFLMEIHTSIVIGCPSFQRTAALHSIVCCNWMDN